MFGQAPATSPFGAPAPAPFGSPAPAPFGGFGQPAAAPAAGGFGAAPAAGGFGAPTGGFGQPAAASSAFGAPAATGAFGQPAPAPAFGAPAGGFGQPAPAPAFGAPAPATGGLFGGAAPAAPFGSPAPAPAFGAKPAGGGLFGSAPAPAGGLFGSAPAPAAGGLFGGAPPAAPFGAPAPATPFGAPAAAPSAFGAPAPSAFGAPAPAAPSAFGTAPAAGGFGQPQQPQAGSTMFPYQTTSKQDGTNQIILQAITAMQQYEAKSFEELRLEDYLAGNKGSKGQAAPAATGFGGFGAAPQPAPAFGQPAPAAFGAPAAPATGGLFGAPAPAPTGLFGAPSPAPAFGQPAPAPAFGAPAAPAPATGGLFGAPAPAPTGGLFGAPTPAPAFGAPAPAPAFGAPAPAAGGLFGAPAPAPTGGLFGAPTPAPAFGQPAAPRAFGAPPPATGGLFGAPAPAPAAGGLFGAPAAPAAGGLFGQPAPAPSLFGQPAPAPTGGLFGAPTPAKPGGLFGAPAPAPGGLFGPTPAPAAGGLFGVTPAATVPIAPPPSADALLAQQLAAVENKKKQLELLEVWRGNPPSGSKVLPTSQYDNSDAQNGWNGGGASYAASSSALLSYRAAPRSTAIIRPRGYTPSKLSPAVSLGRKSGSPILSPNRFVGSATKTLFIKPNALTPKPKTRLLLTNGVSNGNSEPLEKGKQDLPNESNVPTQELKSPTATNVSQPKPIDSISPPGARATGPPTSPAHDFYQQVVDSTGRSPSSAVENKFVPKLSKLGYNVYPSITELEALSEADLAAVTGFKVERPGYGSVEWDGAVDVRGVDIDAVVVIESKNVSVYDEAEETGEKPQQGSKLNRPAVITMYGVWPKDGAESSAEAKAKLTRKIEKSTKKMGAELLSFEEESGVWMFRVGHFSRYGLDDGSDDDSDDEITATPLLEEMDDEQEILNPVEQMKELGGAARIRAPNNEDESTSAYTNVSESETLEENEVEEEVVEIVRAGEEAYAMMTEEVLNNYEEEAIVPYEAIADETEDEIVLFPEEPVEDVRPHIKQAHRPAMPVSCPAPSAGVCSRLADKCGLKNATSSNFDYGMRMRRSFRVGWRPDGSFIMLKPSPGLGAQVLVQSRPVIAPLCAEEGDDKQSSSSASAMLLETHQKHSTKVMETEDNAPMFTLPKSFAGSGSASRSLLNALEDYSKSSAMCPFNSATQKVISNSFSLLVSLYGEDEASGAIDESRRLKAVSTWLKGVVSSDMKQAILAAQSSGDIYGSIFAALSGGDVARASSLALDGGNPRLSLMLCNTGIQAQPFCSKQSEMWYESGAQPFIPTSILRIFSIASGSIDTERAMFKSDNVSYNIDWRRRFGMFLWSCSSQSDDQVTVSSVIKQYGSDMAAGLAPPTTPLYCDKSYMPSSAAKAKDPCILYQMLNHYADTDTSLTGIVTPSSHSPFQHDFSASFHLCASMAALSSSKLSIHEEDLIVDAVTSQLIGEGLWEWAVYASLCIIGGSASSQSTVFVRRLRAKNIISRFYSPSTDPSAGRRRSLLQNMGIPPQWFVEAHAYRCASEGDVFGMADNFMRFSVAGSMAAMEDLIIPNMILEGNGSMRKLLSLLEQLRSNISDDFIDGWNKPKGCGTIYNFLKLKAQVEKLSNMPLDQNDIIIDNLIADASELEAILSKAVAEPTRSKLSLPFIKIPYGFTRTPDNIVLAEVVSMLSFIRMQLIAVKNGQPFHGLHQDSSMTPAYSSRLAFSLPTDGLYEPSISMGAESILRGFCGFKAMG